MQCPECDRTLIDKTFNAKSLLFCEQCRGFWIPYSDQHSFFNYLISNEAILKKFANATVPEFHQLPGGYCPECNTAMESGAFLNSMVPVVECEKCCGVWLRAEQIGPLVASSKLGFLNLGLLNRRRQGESEFETADTTFWKGFFGWITDDIPTREFPLIVWILIAVNVLIFLMELALTREDFLLLAFVPHSFFSNPIAFWYMPLSSMFMHGGIGHLFGNMFFLKLFGDNVEDRIGSPKFAILYLILGITSGIGFALINAESIIPMIGASGAISGVMGAYLVLYPKAKLTFHKLFFFTPYAITLSVWIYVGVWFVLQQLIGILLGVQGVAFLVHLFGLVFGAIIMLAMKQFDLL